MKLIVEQVGRIGVHIIIPGLVFHGLAMGVEYTHSYGPSGPRHRSSLTHVFITFRNRLCLGAFLLGKMMFPFSHKLMPRYILNTIAMNAMRIWTI